MKDGEEEEVKGGKRGARKREMGKRRGDIKRG
jgi:hypothetical protein